MTRADQVRIAIGGFFVECNHFGGEPTELHHFERQAVYRGEQILDQTDGVVGGMLSIIGDRAEPLMWASACAGGPMTSHCCQQIRDELLKCLDGAGELHGVLLPLHGAAAAEDVDDPEGDFIAAVRRCVGPNVPIIVTLDLHAHVTEQMVTHADALIAWETYPHRDTFESGQRAARMMLDTLAGRIRPVTALAKVPVITGAVRGSTEGDDPFARVMRFAKAMEDGGAVLSTSVLLVQPYLDLPGMGSGGLVVTDGDSQLSIDRATQIAEQYWQVRHELEPKMYTPVDAIREGRSIEGGPVLLVETADCCGGGAAGDSVATIGALIDAQLDEPALAPIVDPPAAKACHRAGVGQTVELTLGHRINPQWGSPMKVTGRVAHLSDGRFTYTGGVWSGETVSMGPSAVLEVGCVQILITSIATYDWADEQFRSMDMDIDGAKFIVVKNPMNYRFGYEGLAKAALILDTPGPTPASVRNLPFQKLQRPWFPRDEDSTDFDAVVSVC